ncbi:hypothetical protein GCM10022240_05110 [Microbacterium kribbense]|uniref:RNA polymerase sigma factor 70 region 4 type 2 domain-containing protein n=1 Tax=Microbacterium kribbense TaxID=433645 RepID=A0ABP7G3S3_9MICO
MVAHEPNLTAPAVRNDPIYQAAKRAVARRSSEYRDLFTHEDLQDLTGDVLTAYHRKWTAGSAPDSLDAWMSRVAQAAVVDELRRRNARPKPAPLPAGTDRADAAARLERAFIDLRTPSAVTHCALLVQTALERLGQTHPNDRALLERRHLLGATVAEIAHDLNLKEETVKKRLQRATARLAAILETLDAGA